MALQNSTTGAIEPIAVTVERYGQKPCCSDENNRGTKEFSLKVNNRVSTRYHTEVTEMGRNDAGLSVG